MHARSIFCWYFYAAFAQCSRRFVCSIIALFLNQLILQPTKIWTTYERFVHFTTQFSQWLRRWIIKLSILSYFYFLRNVEYSEVKNPLGYQCIETNRYIKRNIEENCWYLDMNKGNSLSLIISRSLQEIEKIFDLFFINCGETENCL